MASPTSNSSIELARVTSTGSSPLDPETTQPTTLRGDRTTDGEEPDGTQQLEPADGGRAAWTLLSAAFVFESLMWGFPLSYGVFQDYYSQLPEFAGNPYVSVVGTVSSGLGYLGAPLVTPIIRRYSKYRRYMIMVGWPICILGLVAGSFARTLTPLILTQGVMYGIGFLTFYYPILSMVDEFWIRRRGMAYGLLCSASGVSGTIMPLVTQALLRKYGYPTTLRAIAVTLVLTTGPLLPLLKGRLHFTDQSISLRTDWSWIKLPLFWIYTVSNLLMGLGYFFPSLYLPSYATSMGLSAVKGAVLLTVMSVSQVLGQFIFGYLSDFRVPLDILITSSVLIASTATFSSWGVAQSIAPLIVFAMLYGFFGGGYTALWGRMVTAVSEEPTAHQAMFSVFNFGKGVGNVLAGPLSAALLLPHTDRGSYGLLRYKAVVVFTGVCLFLSALSISPWYVRCKRSR